MFDLFKHPPQLVEYQPAYVTYHGYKKARAEEFKSPELAPEGVLYRFEDYLESHWDTENECSRGSSVRVRVLTYEITKRTAQGVWIKTSVGPKFVLLTARRRFACGTLEEACESFLARKAKQESILQRRLGQARQAAIQACRKTKTDCRKASQGFL